MAGTITVKKKKLSFKQEGQGGDDTGAVEEQSMPDRRAMAPLAPMGKPQSYMAAGICALLTLCIFIAVIVLQIMEWNFLSDAFPLPLGSTMSAPASTYVPEPAATATEGSAPAAAEPAAAPAAGGEASERQKVADRNAEVNAALDQK